MNVDFFLSKSLNFYKLSSKWRLVNNGSRKMYLNVTRYGISHSSSTFLSLAFLHCEEDETKGVDIAD